MRLQVRDCLLNITQYGSIQFKGDQYNSVFFASDSKERINYILEGEGEGGGRRGYVFESHVFFFLVFFFCCFCFILSFHFAFTFFVLCL